VDATGRQGDSQGDAAVDGTGEREQGAGAGKDQGGPQDLADGGAAGVVRACRACLQEGDQHSVEYDEGAGRLGRYLGVMREPQGDSGGQQ
jgi:hypothetical protein